MQLWQAIILSIVEGLTEYLPISSTGHLIITSWLMGIHQDPFTKDFTVMVQFGAILAVVAVYWKKLISDLALYKRLIVAFLPAGIIGLLVKNKIDLLLGNVWVVAIALIVGGIALLYTHQIFKNRAQKLKDFDSLTYQQALILGLFQCLAFIPGMSRAASTIWGGLFVGLNINMATQFSFLLALPTLSGASFIKAIKIAPTLTQEQLSLLVVGNIISFIVGYLAIRTFMNWVKTKGLESFGVYRIALGLVVILILLLGHDLTVL